VGGGIRASVIATNVGLEVVVRWRRAGAALPLDNLSRVKPESCGDQCIARFLFYLFFDLMAHFMGGEFDVL
jgi:hypothetical protein